MLVFIVWMRLVRVNLCCNSSPFYTISLSLPNRFQHVEYIIFLHFYSIRDSGGFVWSYLYTASNFTFISQILSCSCTQAYELSRVPFSVFHRQTIIGFKRKLVNWTLNSVHRLVVKMWHTLICVTDSLLSQIIILSEKLQSSNFTTDFNGSMYTELYK